VIQRLLRQGGVRGDAPMHAPSSGAGAVGRRLTHQVRSVAVVVAAGSTERFGGTMLLTPTGGAPLIDRTISLLFNGGVERILVVIGPGAEDLERAVMQFGSLRVGLVENPDPSRGMFSALQVGFAQAEGDALVVLAADMHRVRSGTVAILLDVFGSQPGIVSPKYEGRRGHPVILPPSLREEIVAADPTANLGDIIDGHPQLRVDVDVQDPGVLREVATRGGRAR
jgi:molybdenum cofactor cytidylyltransferase